MSHSPHLKQHYLGKMLQFPSNRGRRLHLCIIERKAKPFIANLKARIEDKAKKWNWSLNHNSEIMAAQVYMNWWHLSSNEKKTKPINGNPKENYWRPIPNPKNGNTAPRPELERDFAARGLTISISVEVFLQELRFEMNYFIQCWKSCYLIFWELRFEMSNLI